MYFVKAPKNKYPQTWPHMPYIVKKDFSGLCAVMVLLSAHYGVWWSFLFVDIITTIFFSISVGDPVPSKKPPSDHKFEKSTSGGYDKRGGGVVIPCIYVLEIVEGKYHHVLEELRNFTSNYAEGTEKIIIVGSSDSWPL